MSDKIGAIESVPTKSAKDVVPRRRKASLQVPAKASGCMPSAAPTNEIGAMQSVPAKSAKAVVPRRRMAKMRVPAKAKVHLPSAVPNAEIGGQATPASNGQNPSASESDVQPERAAVAALLNRIAADQKVRVLCIKAQSRTNRSVEALIASTLGYSNELTEKDRKELFLRAAQIREAVEKGGDGHRGPASDGHHDRAVSALTPLIQDYAEARSLFDKHREAAEKSMRGAARQLPVWESFAKGVNGFGELGLAVIVAEAGKTHDIGAFSSKEKLWLMLGLAVFDGERQQRKTNKEEAALHRFSPRRRAEIYTIGEPLLRAQWAGDRDEDGNKPKKGGKPVAVPAHPKGPYGVLYQRRRAWTEPRVAATADLPPKDRWTPMRCKNDAVRYMTKKLIRDLWREWRKVTPLTVDTK